MEADLGAGKRVKDRFDWRLPLTGVMAGIVVSLLLTALLDDITYFLCVLFLIPILCLGVLWTFLWATSVTVRWRQSLAFVSMLAVYWVISLVMYGYSNRLREDGRWLVHSRDYKARLLSLCPAKQGELSHMEWDGWGFAGEDTTVYLVFDPSESLAAAARSHSPVQVRGIPCKVSAVRRMQKQWYAVTFYTNTSWDGCN